MTEEKTGNIHWSFWLVGALALIWNIMGCINYFSQMNSETVAAMPETYRVIIETRPAWGTGAFAIAVFGGALGGLLLLLRKSAAYYLFIASLLGAIAAQVPLLGIANFPVQALIGGSVQIIIAAILIWYSKQVSLKGWIK